MGSFGVAIWLKNRQDQGLVQGERLPLEEIHQTLGDDPWRPSLSTETPWYRASWQWENDHWVLDLEATARHWQPEIVIRSVGPAGAPIKSLEWDGSKLIVNHRWHLYFSTDGPVSMRLGDERDGFRGREIPRLGDEHLGWLFAPNHL